MTDRYSGDGAGHTVSFTVVSSTATNRPVRRCSAKKSTINWLLGFSATPSIAPNRLYSPVSGKVIGAKPSSHSRNRTHVASPMRLTRVSMHVHSKNPIRIAPTPDLRNYGYSHPGHRRIPQHKRQGRK